VTLESSRRAALRDLKLRTLVRDHLGRGVSPVSTSTTSFGRGAALVDDGVAWVLIEEQPERSLGAALAWMRKQTGAADLAIIVEASSGILARRAELFAAPIVVLHAIDRVLVPAVADGYPPSVELDDRHDAFRSLIEEGGAEPVEEHGVLMGEVRGLEVCRVVTDRDTGEVRLEVGVGAHDRQAFALLHGARPTVEALAEVAETVATHRRAGADPHPLNRLGAERFLRWQSFQEPERLGVRTLRPAAPPVVRTNLKDPVPCVAVGDRSDGSPVVVVYSTGIDLDLVPFAVDAQAMLDPVADLVLVVPERDASPITRDLADLAKVAITLFPWK